MSLKIPRNFRLPLLITRALRQRSKVLIPIRIWQSLPYSFQIYRKKQRKQINAADLGDSDSLKLGQGVVAIGNALGQGQSVTVGYVSALNKKITINDVERTLLQVDAAINPGNSGGALLNMNGEVIGINAAKYSDTSVEGIGYAIPISQAKDIISDLMTKNDEGSCR